MSKDIMLSVLVDNFTCAGLSVEHGFSAWVTVGETSILLDTGSGQALLPNANTLAVDLEQATALVLSHGHYDHTGGVAHFLQNNSHAAVYCAEGFDRDRYSCHSGVPPRAIGMREEDLHALAKQPNGRVFTLKTPHYLAQGVGLTGPIPRTSSFEDAGGPFYFDLYKQQPDLISDDQAMWFETENGLVVLVGCCHAGLINTVNYVRQITGIDQVRGVAGGLHLLHASAPRMKETLAALSEWQLEFLLPCHCTGDAAIAQLCKQLGGKVVRPGRAGITYALGRLP